jgi:thioredoxin 1
MKFETWSMNGHIKNVRMISMTNTKAYLNIIVSLLLLGAAALLTAGCGGQVSSGAGAEPVTVSQVSLDELLTQGLPLILNFGDDGQASQETLTNLEKINEAYSGKVLIRSVDLAASPEAKEGFPVQVMPSQFFYTAEGKPITLPGDLGIVMSSFQSLDTQETVFTIHEGPLTEEELSRILAFMDVK